jgi:prolyl oligopeptidase
MMSAAAADPFGYLEDAADPATQAWTSDQNARTRATLDAVSVRPALAERLDALLRIDAIGVPAVRGARAFFAARRGNADQTVLFLRENGADRTLLDPAELDPSGLTALDWWHPSPNGTYVAFGLSRNGDERSTLHVLDVASGERLSEAIADTRYASVAWRPDERGFYYTRFPSGADYYVRVYDHVLGTASESDPLLFGEGRRPEEAMTLGISSDGRRLAVTVSLGWTRSDVYLADTAVAPLRFVPLVEGVDALFDVRVTNGTLYVRTDEGAPRFRVYAVDTDRLERAAWHEIVPQRSAVLDAIVVSRHALALHYLDNVRSDVWFRRHDGTVERVTLSDGATLFGWTSREDDESLYLLSGSYFAPASVHRLTVSAVGVTRSVWETVRPGFDPHAYRVEQHWFVSKDGTRVPMDVLSSVRTARDGTAPAVLYGYGGFNISLLPSFAPSVLPWLDAGGVYAVANLRGGGEFGERWHRAGMREHKQNVFDDFIAALQYLRTSGIADPCRVTIFGGSNGGLLVSAVATQRPELVRAVVCTVPLTDMLRYHRFLMGRFWIAEYGDPDQPRDAAILRAYSPYHNVRDGVVYPAMLIETAESDARVDPMHARKFAARVQEATAGDAPILAYVEREAGHGAGKPRHKIVDELADRWAFIFRYT